MRNSWLFSACADRDGKASRANAGLRALVDEVGECRRQKSDSDALQPFAQDRSEVRRRPAK